LDHLKADQLSVGGVFYPTADGTAGQIMRTDGSNTVTFVTPDYVDGPVSSTNEAIPVFDGITGKLIKETGAFCNVAGEITCTKMTAANLIYPITDGGSGDFLVTDGAGNISFSTGASSNIHYSSLATTQSIDIDVGDHLKLDTEDRVVGSGITLDTSTTYTTAIGAASIGRYTLASGNTYRIIVHITGIIIDKQSSYITFQLWDVTNDAAIGDIMGAIGAGKSQGSIHLDMAYTRTFFTTSASTLIEVRIITKKDIISIEKCFIDIRQF